MKKNKIPDDRSGINSFSILNEELEKQLHTILAKDIQPNELKAFKSVKTLYKSCTNESMFQSLLY